MLLNANAWAEHWAARCLQAQTEPVAPPMPMPGDAEGLAEVFWNRYDQPEPVAPKPLKERPDFIAGYTEGLADRKRITGAERPPATQPVAPTDSERIEAAFVMGQTGAPPSEVERLAFESWMRGHCWQVEGVWNGTTYDDRGPFGVSSIDVGAMQTRRMWAVWRDCAVLSRPAIQPVPDNTREAVHAAVAEALGGAYDCLRVWSAWGYGTMGPDDFSRVSDDDDRVAEIADAAINALARPTIEPVPVSERPWEREGWCDAEGRCYGWDGDYWWMVGNPGAANETITHCLPHWALPTP
jgi:hypothetical protein